jgi:hypothetical protein
MRVGGAGSHCCRSKKWGERGAGASSRRRAPFAGISRIRFQGWRLNRPARTVRRRGCPWRHGEV